MVLACHSSYIQLNHRYWSDLTVKEGPSEVSEQPHRGVIEGGVCRYVNGGEELTRGFLSLDSAMTLKLMGVKTGFTPFLGTWSTENSPLGIITGSCLPMNWLNQLTRSAPWQYPQRSSHTPRHDSWDLSSRSPSQFFSWWPTRRGVHLFGTNLHS